MPLTTPFAEVALLGLIVLSAIGIANVGHGRQAGGVGFTGRIAHAAHGSAEAAALVRAGTDLVLEPFEDAADRAVALLCGADEKDRTEFPGIRKAGREPA